MEKFRVRFALTNFAMNRLEKSEIINKSNMMMLLTLWRVEEDKMPKREYWLEQIHKESWHIEHLHQLQLAESPLVFATTALGKSFGVFRPHDSESYLSTFIRGMLTAGFQVGERAHAHYFMEDIEQVMRKYNIFKDNQATNLDFIKGCLNIGVDIGDLNSPFGRHYRKELPVVSESEALGVYTQAIDFDRLLD